MSTLIGLIVIVAVFAAYWAPTITAYRRHARNTGSIRVINGLLGWTIIGWIIALAMAMSDTKPPDALT